jgi:hypothetical protein
VNVERVRRRSVGFLDRDGERWSCFLVTQTADDGRWKGFFSFRPHGEESEEDEIRTADIFLETSESEIDRKARALGRPLLSGLLASALHTRERRESDPPALRRWLRQTLNSNSRELSRDWQGGTEPTLPRSLAELRSIYSSYRLDQVTHLIGLIDPEDFQGVVDRILDGQSFDFGAKDRLQFAMMVVEHLEALLPLPPFEVWVRDFMEHTEAYRTYTYALHREDELP